MKYLLGIDLGTTGLKAAVFDLAGNLIGRGYVSNIYLPGLPERAEQDPRSWWDACCQAIRQALIRAKVKPVDVKGIGVCGFHHCPVFIDRDGEPARPTIVTHDTRLGQSLDNLRQEGILKDIIQTSGSLVTTGHFPAIYNYVLKNDRQALDKTRWILLAKDYIRYKLTGKVGTEICDATGTHLIAMPGQEWSDLLCDLLKVPKEKLPEIGKPSQIFGQVTREAAKASGLKPGIPVVYGGGDSHCALLGLGVIGSGEVGLLLGTNSTLRVSFQSFIRDPEARVWVQQHVVPDRYTVSASSMAGSSILSWFKEKFCREYSNREESKIYSELESLAGDIPPGCDGLLFHPYLYGERSPFYNAKARGSFLAITEWHGKGHFLRSIMEGIAFCIANCFDLIKDIARIRKEEIKVVRIGEGGGTRLNLWRQIIADAIGFPLEVIRIEEPGCLGAALLAGVGIGVYSDIQTAVDKTIKISSTVFPDSKNSAFYNERREIFNRTYNLLEPILYR